MTPEKCEAVFGQGHAPKSTMPEIVKRFSDDIVLSCRGRFVASA